MLRLFEDHSLVRRVLRHWGISDCRCQPLAKVIRVTTADGDYCLKPVVKSQDRLSFMHGVQEHVRARGFSQLGFLRLTAQGGVAAWEGGLAWALSQWLPGRELDYHRTTEISKGAATMARFHQAGADFPAPGRRGPASNLGKWPAKVASRCGELLCAARTASRGPAREFQAELAVQLAALSEHAQRSLTILSESGYAERSRASQETIPVCHGDPAAHNFVIGHDGEVALIDLNSLRADLPCVDLWKLLHRMGFYIEWAPGPLTTVLDAYTSVRHLDDLEARVLLGLLWFPEKQWRLAYNASRCLPDLGPEKRSTKGERSNGTEQRIAAEMASAGRALLAKEDCLSSLEHQLLAS